jgi:predicted nucleic acid-binding protein
MDRELFLDSSFAIAQASASDQYHEIAATLKARIKLEQPRLITTRAVFLEIGNWLAKRKYRSVAFPALWALENDPGLEIVPLTDDYYARALILFRDRADKEWGLVDCFSFVVMKERGIKQALTSDEHFEQAGFQALLRTPPT